jgi:hypothetical protein
MNSFANASASNLGLLVADFVFRTASDCPLLVGVPFTGVVFPLLSLSLDGVLGVLGVLGALGVSPPLLVDKLLLTFFDARFSSNLGFSPVNISEYFKEFMFNLFHASGYIKQISMNSHVNRHLP